MTHHPVVQLRSVVHHRGTFRLRVADWKVYPGQVIGIVGPNGAGKSTLLDLLPGLRRPREGEVRVLGRDPWRDPVGVRTRIGFMRDDLPVFQQDTGALLKTMAMYYPTWDATHAEALRVRFGLDPATPTWELSKGQATRLRLVLALAHRPSVVILDEPATGLDLAGRRDMLRTVLEAAADGETSVLVSSHQLADLEQIADRLLVLGDGEVVREGRMDELVEDGASLEEAMTAWQAV